MEIKLNSLKLNLDKYKKNIQIVSNNKREIENIILCLKCEWEKIGGIFYNYGSEVTGVIKNRIKYSDGNSQVPILLVCQDELDLTWLYKVQDVSQVQIIHVDDKDKERPNFHYQLISAGHDKYWSLNGSLYKIPVDADASIVESYIDRVKFNLLCSNAG